MALEVLPCAGPMTRSWSCLPPDRVRVQTTKGSTAGVPRCGQIYGSDGWVSAYSSGRGGGERKEARETVDAGQRQTDGYVLFIIYNFTSRNDWYVWEV